MQLNMLLEEASQLSKAIDEQQNQRTNNNLILLTNLGVVLLLFLGLTSVLYFRGFVAPILRASKLIRTGRVSELDNTSQISVSELSELNTALINSHSRLEYDATHDYLTGLPNRLQFSQRLHTAISRCQRSNSECILVTIDLDDFKNINDSLGHNAGDKLLTLAAERLQSIIRNSDCFARQGGDEFNLLIEDIQDQDSKIHARQIAYKIINAFKVPFDIESYSHSIGASLGIAIYPRDGQNESDLLRNSDTALYKAKARGKSTFAFYSSEMTEEAEKRLELENDIRKGLQENQFYLDYQVQYDLNRQQVVGLEALIRWRHPQKGIISPASFIPIAEQSALIKIISDWVMAECFQQVRKWRNEGHIPPRVSINLPASHFRQIEFVAQVKTLLKENDLLAAQFCFEITEYTFLKFGETTKYVINQLREMGVKISVDDFGTGYSSLSYIHTLPVDEIKIDKSFVENIGQLEGNAAVVDAILALTKDMDFDVIAEGVETEEQRDYLLSKGCYLVQGYLIGKPGSPQQVSAQFHSDYKGGPNT